MSRKKIARILLVLAVVASLTLAELTPRFSSCAARTLRALFQFKTRSAASAAPETMHPARVTGLGNAETNIKSSNSTALTII